MHYDIEFKSQNDTCAGRLYVPDAERRARAIVLAHGLCGTADSGLYEMADGFAQNGFHALVFDYRNFGKSGGKKRQHISVPMQREDWQAALDCIRSLENIDPDRVGLWGFSFSGGHVLYTACDNACVRAVVSQAPVMDMHLSLVLGDLWRGEKATQALHKEISRNLLRFITGRKTGYIAAVPEGDAYPVMLNAPEAPEYLAIAGPSFENRISIESFLSGKLETNNPTELSDILTTPTLIQVGAKDEMSPQEPIKTFVRRTGPVVAASSYDCGHFGMLRGQLRRRAIAEAVAHFDRFL